MKNQPIEQLEDGRIKFYKDRMQIEVLYSCQIGKDFLILVKGNNNEVRVYSSDSRTKLIGNTP